MQTGSDHSSQHIVSSDEILLAKEKETCKEPYGNPDKDSEEQQHIVNTQDQDDVVNGGDQDLGTDAHKHSHVMDENQDQKGTNNNPGDDDQVESDLETDSDANAETDLTGDNPGKKDPV